MSAAGLAQMLTYYSAADSSRGMDELEESMIVTRNDIKHAKEQALHTVRVPQVWRNKCR